MPEGFLQAVYIMVFVRSCYAKSEKGALFLLGRQIGFTIG